MSEGFYHIKKWDEFQHYKYRTPPWIKLHRRLLDDREYRLLPAVARALLIDLWLIASESNGFITADPETIAFRVRDTVEEVTMCLGHLLAAGFLEIPDAAPVSLHLPKQSRG